MTLSKKQAQEAALAALKRVERSEAAPKKSSDLNTTYQKPPGKMQAKNPEESGTWSPPPDYPIQERKPEDI